jgi:hypothetical protein
MRALQFALLPRNGATNNETFRRLSRDYVAPETVAVKAKAVLHFTIAWHQTITVTGAC